MGTWSEERIAALTELWNDGVASGLIAERLGLSKNAVVGKAHRLGLKPRGNVIERSKRLGARKRARSAAQARARAELLPEVKRTIVAPEDIRPGACQWPVGEPGTPGFGFCGQAVAADGHAPYCADHQRRAYRPAPPLRPVFADGRRAW